MLHDMADTALKVTIHTDSKYHRKTHWTKYPSGIIMAVKLNENVTCTEIFKVKERDHLGELNWIE
jgi:hypothetical protein